MRVWKSFGFAVEGIISTFRSEFMFRFYSAVLILVFTLALIVHLPLLELLFLMICWTIVLSFELINTGVEKAIDATSIHNQLTKFAKDAAAGSVAISGVMSGVVSLILIIKQLF